jgi:hypothetical protein
MMIRVDRFTPHCTHFRTRAKEKERIRVGTLAAERMQWRCGCNGGREGAVAPRRRGHATRAGRRGLRRGGTFSAASEKKTGGGTEEKRGGS